MKNPAQRTIFYVQYENPEAYPPLEHSTRILADTGWNIHLWGVEIEVVKNLRFPPHPRIDLRLFRPYSPGWRQKIHYLEFGIRTLFLWARLRPNWVYASNPSVAPVALLLKMFGARIVYHEHDSPEPATHLMGRFIQWARRKLGERAEVVVFPQAQRMAPFYNSLRKPKGQFLTVFNCGGIQDVRPTSHSQSGSEPLQLITHGSFTYGRPPEALLRALSGLSVHLHLVGYHSPYEPEFPEHLRKLLAAVRPPARTTWHAPRPRHEILPLLQKADVGVHLYTIQNPTLTVRNMAGASVKVFEFLSQGLPVLLSDFEEWREFNQSTPCLVLADPNSEESIRRSLEWLISNRGEAAKRGESGRLRSLRDWNYEYQFRPVLEILQGEAPHEASMTTPPPLARRRLP